MKIPYSFIIIIASIFIFSCQKTNDPDKPILSDCDTLPEWNGNDQDCGCFGPSIGFSDDWCISLKGGEITYFAKSNFHHIQDSLCFVYDPALDKAFLVNVDRYGFHSEEVGTTIKEAIDRKWKLIYSFDYRNATDVSDELLSSESKIELDPNAIKTFPDQLTFKAYKYKMGVPGKIKLDSTEIVFVKQLNRK